MAKQSNIKTKFIWSLSEIVMGLGYAVWAMGERVIKKNVLSSKLIEGVCNSSLWWINLKLFSPVGKNYITSTWNASASLWR